MAKNLLCPKTIKLKPSSRTLIPWAELGDPAALRSEIQAMGLLNAIQLHLQQQVPGWSQPVRFSAGGIPLSAEKDQVLVLTKLTSRSKGFPKGRIERGETPAHAAWREMLEETGFEAEIGDLVAIQVRCDPESPRTKVCLWFQAKVDPRVRSGEGETETFNIAWQPVETALNELSSDNDRELLRLALGDLPMSPSQADWPARLASHGKK